MVGIKHKSAEKSWSEGGDTVCRKYGEMSMQRGHIFMDTEGLEQAIITANNSEGPIIYLAAHPNYPHNPMMLLK